MSLVDLPARLAGIRAQYGWTLRELVAQIEATGGGSMSFSYLSALEKGKSAPSLATLERIAGAYQLTLCELLQCCSEDQR